MSLAQRGPGISRLFGRIFGLFSKPKDPVTRSIYDAVSLLDRMIAQIEVTYKSLENIHEENSRKAKIFASEGKKNYEKIFLEELKHISGLMAMMEKVKMDLMRVKVRLETLTHVEQPMRILPEVIQELQAIRPQVEKIAPELTMYLLEVERKVSSIMSTSNIAETFESATSLGAFRENVPANLPPLPPETTPVTKPPEQASTPARSVVRVNVHNNSYQASNVPLSIVKNWVLNEIMNNGGILDVQAFTRKYKVPKSLVFKALIKLEQEGRVKISR